ncbi:MAG: pirin family protein [Saprospiraceae bacterium]|nr:pirin family protein [Saprospiraceae bacterium]
MNNKFIAHFYRVDHPHMVGDGFRVKGYLPGPYDLQQEVSPFYLLDYNSPHFFPATETPRGVGVHPHKGFETVTIVFEGELAHADSTGSSGTIGKDEVQWMTAGPGYCTRNFRHRHSQRRVVSSICSSCGSICRLRTNFIHRDTRPSPGRIFPS